MKSEGIRWCSQDWLRVRKWSTRLRQAIEIEATREAVSMMARLKSANSSDGLEALEFADEVRAASGDRVSDERITKIEAED